MVWDDAETLDLAAYWHDETEHADVDDSASGYRGILLGVFGNRLRAVSAGSDGRHCGALCTRACRWGALYAYVHETPLSRWERINADEIERRDRELEENIFALATLQCPLWSKG